MQTVKTLLASIVLGSLAFFLFVIGLGFMMFMLITMLIAGLFVNPQKKAQWQQKWSPAWVQRQQFGKNGKASNTDVIEGQYTVVESH
ncbi:MAG: hypothetical protein CR975_07455 [Gammaproteobacteria bacterium]|nr:MAG: hypothetical protein CR975_07455 [Gammaproteobacteria bacterium]